MLPQENHRGRMRWSVWRLAVLAMALAIWGHPAQSDAQTAPRAGEAAGKPAAAPSAESRQPSFTRTDQEGAHFSLDQIEGAIRLDGAYHGVTRLVDKRSGRQVIDTRYSALNLFKLMSVNLVMGQPRAMQRTVQVTPHRLEVKWAATETHRAELLARYELRPPQAVDLTVTVRSRRPYAGYELFLSNYFDKVLQPHVYLNSRDGKSADVVLPTFNDVFRGTVLVFSRDTHAARLCADGRWDRDEGPTPIVQMCPVRHYAHCLAVMTDPEKQLGVVLMASPRHCYAISTRYHANEEANRLTTYSAFDFSLFGDNLLPGDERTVRVRLALTPLDREMSQPLKLYQAFLAECGQDSR